ncbi:MAG: Fis family transcriptional regulator [Kofleriaceae bacterium]|jgi:pathogenesis-related protein 1|nr:Fis family transcriptional regulator [Kofleriaceae bacterium]
MKRPMCVLALILTAACGGDDGGGGGGGGGDSEPAALSGTLAAHNAVRATVDVPALAWDGALADIAQAWADQCVDQEAPIGLIDHNEGRSEGYPSYVGENVYGSSGAATGPDAVAAWASEEADYDHASNTCSGVCGHYTQLVWRDTTHVGCAIGNCAGLRFGNVVVCNYGPGGNVNGARPY